MLEALFVSVMVFAGLVCLMVAAAVAMPGLTLHFLDYALRDDPHFLDPPRIDQEGWEYP